MFVSKHHPLYQTDEVGKANPTLRNLPPQDHFYGYKPPPQPEVHEPTQKKPKQVKKNDKDFSKINIMTQGQSKLMNSIKPDIRKNTKKGQLEMLIKLPEEQFAYGKKGKPQTPLKKILCQLKRKLIWK